MKFYGKLFSIVVSLLLLAGCSNDDNVFKQEDNTEGLKTFTSFTATLDDLAGTRAYLDAEASNGIRRVHWEQGDIISVYSDTDLALKEFVMTGLDENGVGTFIGEEVTGNQFYAVFAPNKEVEVDADDPNVIHIKGAASNIVADQDTDAHFTVPMVATTTGSSFSFKQTAGLVQINVGNVHQIDDLFFRGSNLEPIGEYYLVDMSNNKPVLKLEEGANSVGYGQCIKNLDDKYVSVYYILPPMVFESGFLLTISGVDKDGKEFEIEKSFDSRFEVKAGSISSFTLLDISAELEADKIIEFADPIAKQICVENWDTNRDGELSYAEAAAVTDIGTLFQNDTESAKPNPSIITKDMVSFDEFQYFTGVTELKEAAFLLCMKLQSIILPKSLISIGSRAFIQCRSLTELEIPEGVREIGGRAFSSTSLQRLHIPASLVSFGSIDNCITLNEITVDSNNPVYDSRENCNAIIETATNTLLYGCNNTKIPSSVAKIAASALSGYSGFTSDNLDLGNVISVGAYAFSSTNLTGTLRIPATLVEIGNSAFSGSFTSIVVDTGNPVYDSRDNCNAIIETADNELIVGCSATQIPNGVAALGNGAFQNVQGLGNVVIPPSVTSLGSSVFNGSDIKSVEIPEGVTAIPVSCFANCSELETVKLPSTLKEIASSAFLRNYKLKHINFPEGLMTIGDWAFQNHVLETIDLPSTLTSIGRDAFSGNNSVATVIVRAIEPPVLKMWNSMLTLPKGATYYVPAESIEDYKKAEGWNQISNFLPITE
ncbi:MAG: leucine-rich repeat protein [Bacteroidaceae bacterium]|nr:leucine-rich repeat protein [Bacteroidaceae bacterium]